jgi:sugar lactone lactonase YvrE
MSSAKAFRLRTLLCSILLLTLCQLILAQVDQKDGRYYEALARKAYQEKNYPTFLENMKLAAQLRPNHPRLMYNLAVAHALNGHQAEAVKWLRRTADMGLIFPASSDNDFESLRDLPDFKEVLKRFEKNKAPKISSLQAFTIQEKDLVPESVAYDETADVFYLSSVYKRKILSITPSGEVKVFAGESDVLWSVMGMKVDRANRVLWVCTTAHQQMSNYRPEDKGKSALLKYDLKNGTLLGKFEPGDTTKPHWLGDLAVNSQGDVFATDSVTPAIYVVRHDSKKLETFLEGTPFISPQGLDFTKDQKQLFVADYSKGIFLVDLKTKKASSIASDFALLGIDGLYAYKGSLICVQNGVNPQRVIRLTLNKNLNHFDRFETIEANNPVFDEPTLGVLVKDRFYFIANSQWGAIDQSGRLAPTDKLKEPTILKLKL